MGKVLMVVLALVSGTTYATMPLVGQSYVLLTSEVVVGDFNGPEGVWSVKLYEPKVVSSFGIDLINSKNYVETFSVDHCFMEQTRKYAKQSCLLAEVRRNDSDKVGLKDCKAAEVKIKLTEKDFVKTGTLEFPQILNIHCLD